jgi:hypothetical protein
MKKNKFECPHCEQPLETTLDMVGEEISCPCCSSVLEIPKYDKSFTKLTNQDSIRTKNTKSINKTAVFVFSVTSVTVMVCFGIYIQSTRYTVVNAGNQRIYKIDRKSGDTVLILGSREFPVGVEQENPLKGQVRDLTNEELSKLTGRAGLAYSNRFSGNIYNGNTNISISSLSINISTTINGTESTRTYYIDVNISPQTTESIGANIIIGDKDAPYNWNIVGAKGWPSS